MCRRLSFGTLPRKFCRAFKLVIEFIATVCGLARVRNATAWNGSKQFGSYDIEKMFIALNKALNCPPTRPPPPPPPIPFGLSPWTVSLADDVATPRMSLALHVCTPPSLDATF